MTRPCKEFHFTAGISTVGNREQCRDSWANYIHEIQCNTLTRNYSGKLKWDSHFHVALSDPINLTPRKSSFACAQGHSRSTQILAESFTATYRYIYKGVNSDWEGWPVMEVVSSVPLKEPGYCPRSQNRNVAELDLANNRHQFVVATHQSWGQPRAESLLLLCPGPWPGTAVFTFSVWETCEGESVACCLSCPQTLVSHIVTCFTFFLFCSSSSNSITNNLIDSFTQIFS